MTDAEFDTLVNESLAYMHRAIEECNQEWDFQSYQRWDIDLDRRVLVFSDGPRPPIDCDIQVADVYMTNRNFWRWSWDNPSLEPALRTELEKVRVFGEVNGIRDHDWRLARRGRGGGVGDDRYRGQAGERQERVPGTR
jgi:hypothetical protein